MNDLAKEVKEVALKEFKEEEFRRKVDLEKERLRLRRSFWVRIFPWKITITRRDTPKEAPRQAWKVVAYDDVQSTVADHGYPWNDLRGDTLDSYRYYARSLHRGMTQKIEEEYKKAMIYGYGTMTIRTDWDDESIKTYDDYKIRYGNRN